MNIKAALANARVQLHNIFVLTPILWQHSQLIPLPNTQSLHQHVPPSSASFCRLLSSDSMLTGHCLLSRVHPSYQSLLKTEFITQIKFNHNTQLRQKLHAFWFPGLANFFVIK
jgi:hypothetical protein